MTAEVNPYASPQAPGAGYETPSAAEQNDVRLGRRLEIVAPADFDELVEGLRALGLKKVAGEPLRGLLWLAPMMLIPAYWAKFPSLSLLVSAIPVYRILSNRWKLRALRRRQGLTRRAVVSESGIEIEPDAGDASPARTFAWTEVTRTALTENVIAFLFGGEGNAATYFVVARRSFATEMEWLALRGYVRARFEAGIERCDGCERTFRAELLNPLPAAMRRYRENGGPNLYCNRCRDRQLLGNYATLLFFGGLLLAALVLIAG